MERTEGDLAHFGLALLDVAAQQQLGLIELALQDGAQDLGVLDVRGLDPVVAREVEATDDANALGHVPVHARHLGVAGGANQRRVELLVEGADLAHVAEALGRRHQPRNLQRIELGRVVGTRAEPGDAGQLEHDAQVVELIELVEVDGLDEPATLAFDFEKAFIAQAEQGFPHRRAADAQALSHLRFREAVAGQELEVVDQRLQLRIGVRGEIGAGGLANNRAGGDGQHGLRV